MKTVILVTFLIFASSCQENDGPLLRVGTNLWAGYETLYLARAKGYLDQQKIRLVELTSATQVMNAFRSGNLELAALTLDEVLTLADEGFKLKVILVMDISQGADVLVTKKEISTLQDLKGKKVGYEQTAVGAVMLQGILSAGGLSANDIIKVHVTSDAHVSSFNNKKLDAVITYEPYSTFLKNDTTHFLFTSNDIPGRIIDVLVAHEDVVHRNKQELEYLVRSHFRALAYLKSEPETAAEIMAPRIGLSPKSLLRTYDGLSLPYINENKELFSGSPKQLEGIALQLSKVLIEAKLIKKSINVSNLFDGRFIPGN